MHALEGHQVAPRAGAAGAARGAGVARRLGLAGSVATARSRRGSSAAETMGRRAAPSQRVVAVQEHAASRAIVPESALPFGGPSLPGAPEYKAPAWWPDDGEEYLISVAADTFDGDWEWVQSPRQQLSSPDSHPARQDSESEAGSPAESASLDLDKLGNDLAELYAIVCKTPPQCVKQVLAAVCIALCVSPQQSAGNRRGSYFAAGRELLHDSSNLLLRLSTFDPEELLADTARRRALEDAVGKISVSRVRMAACSAAGLAQWVHNAVSRVGAAEQRAVARRTTAATSRTEYSGLPGAGGAAGVAVSCHTRTNVGAHYGLQRGPPWSPWDDETSDPEHHRLRKTSEDYCGWDVDGAPIGRRQPPKRYSASDAKAAARQAQAELLGVDVPTISVSQAVRPLLTHHVAIAVVFCHLCSETPANHLCNSVVQDYQQHAPTAKLRCDAFGIVPG